MAAPQLLADDRVQHFITDGYILVDTGANAPVHRRIYTALEEVFARGAIPATISCRAFPK